MYRLLGVLEPCSICRLQGCNGCHSAGADDAKVDLRYLGLQVSRDHLKEQSEQQMRHLLRQKRLVIVLDLDHTLLHTELKSRLYPEVIPPLIRKKSAVVPRAKLVGLYAVGTIASSDMLISVRHHVVCHPFPFCRPSRSFSDYAALNKPHRCQIRLPPPMKPQQLTHPNIPAQRTQLPAGSVPGRRQRHPPQCQTPTLPRQEPRTRTRLCSTTATATPSSGRVRLRCSRPSATAASCASSRWATRSTHAPWPRCSTRAAPSSATASWPGTTRTQHGDLRGCRRWARCRR